MKLKTISLAIIAAFVALALFTGIKGQDKPKDTVKGYVGFTSTEYSFESLFSTEYRQGLTAELDAKVAGNSKVRLGGVFQFNRASFEEPAIDTYSFGPRLSYKIGFVEPFGHALFGFQTTYNRDRTFTRTYGAGVDLNFGHVFIRPAVIDFVRTEGFASPATQRFGAGIGVRF
jgi:hypothetical protein